MLASPLHVGRWCAGGPLVGADLVDGKTSNTYSHVIPALGREAAERMDAVLQERRSGG
jgi:hypothetical protein